MLKTLALALTLVVGVAPLAPVAAQWKPEIKFL